MTSTQRNIQSISAPKFQKLSLDQLERIHFASLEILERTGVRLLVPEAVKLLKSAGADVIDDSHVRIPSYLVDWALNIAPKRIAIANRHGERVMPLERRNVFYGPGSDCPNVIDINTGKRRPGKLQDIVDGIHVCDALPNIDFVMSLNIAGDVPQEYADIYQMQAMLKNTSKPIMFVTTEFDGCVKAVEMAELVAGGADALRRNPFIFLYINVTAPLVHNEEALQKLLFMAEKGLPTSYTPVVLRGASGPITPAGAVAYANAGELAGLVIAQLKREGTPVILSGGTQDMLDMRTMLDIYAAPDNRVLCVEMAQYYGLPIFGLGGASDAKLPDQQAAAEAAFSLLTETMAGSHLIHDVGYLEGGLTNSIEMIVMCDELIHWVKKFMQGVEVSEETLALDWIDQVGFDDDFLGIDHTHNHFKEDWYPTLLDRQDHAGWSADGELSLRDRARERIKSILAEHQPKALPNDVAEGIQAVIDRTVK
ncbi:MAG: trimethylamine methyltransferase family protein [Anaerolineales bacterium]|nr:trimethylamine methyltransferase family protein [Chloroflexota bacterium]MBL6981066.1 trimethylamine methyltransferase family protein [Anaerolineales bacterium]